MDVQVLMTSCEGLSENEDQFGSTLEDLQKHFANEQSLPAICSGEALEIARNILFLTPDVVIEKLKSVHWQSFEYKIRLYLAQKVINEDNSVSNFLATFNLVHFVILAQKPKLLQFLQHQDQSQVLAKVKVANESKLVIREESWIFGASSAHLAARFFPQGLDLILSEENICKALINCKAGPRETSPIHVASLSTHSLSVKILLSHGVDVNAIDIKGYTPIFYAAKLKEISTLYCLLKEGKADTNCTGDNNKNVFYKARTYEAAMLLRKYGAETLIDPDPDPRTQSKTALKDLVKRNCSESPIALLDDTIHEVRDKLYTIDLTSLNEDRPHLDLHTTLAKNHRMDLSLHPTMEIYLHMQWKRVWKIFIILLILNLLFVFTQTYLGVKLVNWLHCEPDPKDPTLFHSATGLHFYTINETSKLQSYLAIKDQENGGYTKNETAKVDIKCYRESLRKEDENGQNSHASLEYFAKLAGHDTWDCWYTNPINLIIICVFIPYFLLREGILILSGGIKAYLCSFENLLQVLSMILTMCLLWLGPESVEFGIHAATWAIFMSWIAVTCQLARFDNFGEYVFMSIRVSATVVKFLMVYVPCMMAFSFAFHLSLHQNRIFSGPMSSFLKVFVMFQGEFEYIETFSYQQVKDDGARNYTTQILFIMFAITFGIVIMNLLIALTIKTTDQLVLKGAMTQSKKKLKSILLCNGFVNFVTKYFPGRFLDPSKCKKIAVMFRGLEATDYFTYYKNEWLKGGNFPLYKVNMDQSLSPLGISINEKYVDSLKQRLATKELKLKELEKTLKSINENAQKELQELQEKNTQIQM